MNFLPELNEGDEVIIYCLNMAIPIIGKVNYVAIQGLEIETDAYTWYVPNDNIATIGVAKKENPV